MTGKRRLEVAAVAAGAAALAAVLGVALGGSTKTLTTRSAVPSVPAPSSASSATASSDPRGAPAWPAESRAGARPKDPRGGRCNEVRHGGAQVDPARGWPFDLKTLSSRSAAVAVVRAVARRSWWHTPGAGERGDSYGVLPMTATNFRVERTVRGTLPSYVQTVQDGAPQDGSFPCWQWAYQISNDPLPDVGHRYVLFLQAATGGYEASFRSADRFEVVANRVHSLRDFYPGADLTFAMEPEPLESFLRRV